MVEGYGMPPEPANTSAVCRYRLCLWRRPDALRVLAHQFFDHVEKHDRVWVCRRIDIARHWKATHPFNPTTAFVW